MIRLATTIKKESRNALPAITSNHTYRERKEDVPRPYRTLGQHTVGPRTSASSVEPLTLAWDLAGGTTLRGCLVVACNSVTDLSRLQRLRSFI